MQSEFPIVRGLKPGVKFLILLILAIFVFSFIPIFKVFVTQLCLEPLEIKVWQNVTYMFVHTEVFHMFFNLMGIFFIGNAIEAKMGQREFLSFFCICGLGGAIATHLVYLFGVGGLTLGASGAIYGLLYACYYFYPQTVVYLYFVFPVKIKWLLLFYGMMDLIMLFNSESKYAHYAHLGGLFTGMVYMNYGSRISRWQIEMKQKNVEKEEEKIEKLKLKVDEILDKISKSGMGSLTAKEKKFLEKSSKKYR